MHLGNEAIVCYTYWAWLCCEPINEISQEVMVSTCAFVFLSLSLGLFAPHCALLHPTQFDEFIVFADNVERYLCSIIAMKQDLRIELNRHRRNVSCWALQRLHWQPSLPSDRSQWNVLDDKLYFNLSIMIMWFCCTFTIIGCCVEFPSPEWQPPIGQISNW